MSRPAIFLVSAIAMAGPAAAHHGVAGTFDESKTIKISGVVKQMHLVNPHSWVTLVVKNNSGSEDTWACEMRAGALLKRSGWTEAMFSPGTQLYIVAAPHREDPHKCYVETVTFQDGRTIERYEQLATADKGEVKRPLRTADGKPNLAGNWGAAQKLNAVNNGTNTAAVIAAVSAGRTPPPASKLATTAVVNFGDFSKAPASFAATTPHEAPNASAERGGGMGPGAPAAGAPRAGSPASGAAPAAAGMGVSGEAVNASGRFGTYKPSAAGLAAAAAYATANTGNARGGAAAGKTCATTNMFTDWTMDQHVNRIQQTKETLKIDYGYMDISRTVYLNMAAHPKDAKPSKWGHSIGRWEGDTLVVDTANFLAGPIGNGVMHSDRYHLVERFTMSSDGKTLTRSWTGEDPLYLTESFSGQDSVEISQTPYEPYNCTDLTYSPVS